MQDREAFLYQVLDQGLISGAPVPVVSTCIPCACAPGHTSLCSRQSVAFTSVST